MKLTVGKLRRIIRESISQSISELDIGSRNTGTEELADVLGFDWYSLTPSEKRDFGDLMMTIKSRGGDKRLMMALHNLPLEKHFASSSPGGVYTAPEDGVIDFDEMLRKIKTNYTS